MFFDPTIWGPHYWFFLHTIAESYPDHPNEVTKRKYYDLIQNMPIYIPISEIGNKFSHLLDKYPITPYLCSKESVVRWMHFIHNKIKVLLEKQEISFGFVIDSKSSTICNKLSTGVRNNSNLGIAVKIRITSLKS